MFLPRIYMTVSVRCAIAIADVGPPSKNSVCILRTVSNLQHYLLYRRVLLRSGIRLPRLLGAALKRYRRILRATSTQKKVSEKQAPSRGPLSAGTMFNENAPAKLLHIISEFRSSILGGLVIKYLKEFVHFVIT